MKKAGFSGQWLVQRRIKLKMCHLVVKVLK